MDSIETLQEKVARLASILKSYQQTVDEERILLSRFFIGAADVMASLAEVINPGVNSKKTSTPSDQFKSRTIRSLAGSVFTIRLANLLHAMEIETVEDITQHHRFDFMKCRGLGRKAMNELDRFVEKHGLSFKPLEED